MERLRLAPNTRQYLRHGALLHAVLISCTIGYATPARAAGRPRRVTSDRALIEQQDAIIRAQQVRLDDLARRLQEVEQQLARNAPAPATPTTTPATPPAQVAAAPATDSSAPQGSEKPARPADPGPATAASAPALASNAAPVPKGFVAIPGTQAVMRIGGRLQLDAMFYPSAGAGESEDFFYPRLLNGAGPHFDRTRFSARDSRVLADFRLPTAFGQVRAYTEWDFFGAIPANSQSQLGGYTPRLRQLYVEVGPGAQPGGWSFLAGQAWSTFNDTTAYANVFNGLPFGSVFVRQPQLRFTKWLSKETSIAVALENPEGDVAGATGGNANEQFDALPDLVVNAHTEQAWGGLQAGLLVRQVQETVPDAKKAAWGVSLGGHFKVAGMGRDMLRFQTNYGDALGRYIGELGPTFDGRVTPDKDDFDLNRVFAGNVSYEHYWADHWSSSLALSQVSVDNPDFAPDDALARTRTLTLTALYTPITGLDFGVEYIWAEKKTEDGTIVRRSAPRFTTRYVF